jgi:hypothetical protein
MKHGSGLEAGILKYSLLEKIRQIIRRQFVEYCKRKGIGF